MMKTGEEEEAKEEEEDLPTGCPSLSWPPLVRFGDPSPAAVSQSSHSSARLGLSAILGFSLETLSNAGRTIAGVVRYEDVFLHEQKHGGESKL